MGRVVSFGTGWLFGANLSFGAGSNKLAPALISVSVQFYLSVPASTVVSAPMYRSLPFWSFPEPVGLVADH